MNKVTWLVAGLFVACAGQAQAAEKQSPTYSQYQAAVGIGFDQGLSAILEVDQDYRLALGNDGIAADYIFKRGGFNDPDIPFDWYVGAGVWKNWQSHNDFGARLPVGVNWIYNNRFQLYGQVQPELVLHDDVKLQLGAAIGITYKF